jgi:hypothetical protein
MLHPEKIVKFKVDFRTGSLVFPPYSYKYELEGRHTDAGLHLDYTLVYTDREDMDESELLEEDFSLNDDRKFSTTIPLVWWQEFQKMAGRKPARTKEEPHDEMHIDVTDAEGNTTELELGGDLEQWAYLMQEMIQAGLESDGQEDILMLGFMLQVRQEQKHAEVHISFADRSFKLLTWYKDRHKTSNLPWSQSRELMDMVYNIDYDSDKAKDKPTGTGFFIQLNDGKWYKTGEAANDLFMPLTKKLETAFKIWFV